MNVVSPEMPANAIEFSGSFRNERPFRSIVIDGLLAAEFPRFEIRLAPGRKTKLPPDIQRRAGAAVALAIHATHRFVPAHARSVGMLS